VLNTGYHRKYAIRLLNHPSQGRGKVKRRRKGKYPATIRYALVTLWRAANCICGKRLAPFLGELISCLERHQELSLDPSIRALLLEISPATVDRLLHRERQLTKPRALGTTKPGTLLKKQIPVRTYADWNEHRAGFLEVDLVAHCGRSTDGEYLHTLVLTDIHTTWTECVALLNRSQQTVSEAIVQVRQALPFPLLGLDSDNGSEFINDNLFRYCLAEQITFTRSRPYKKNDQAHVEQKNWTHVRQFVGYGRFEGSAAQQALATLYQPFRLYMNFFQPTLKLLDKEQVGTHVRKHYDTAKTPYQRVLDAPEVSQQTKDQLRLLYESLNPVALLRQLDHLRDGLWSLETVTFSPEATIRQSKILT
jgi:Integrase core domain